MKKKSKIKNQKSKINWKLEIGNWKFPHSGLGFTLVELLVVVTLMGIISIIVTQVFTLGLRLQAKVEVVKDVKQNSDYAISAIEGIIRDAIDVSEAQCNESSSQLAIIGQDGWSTTFDCSSGSLASISGVLEVIPTVSYPLTNDEVTVSGCNFRVVCPTPPLSPKYVFVNFTINQSGAGTTPESRASFEYQTTVSLRTYK